MDTLQNSQESIHDLESKINAMNTQLVKQLAVISNTQEFALKQTQELKTLVADGYDNNAKSKIVFARADVAGGTFNLFGSSIHQAFVKEPTNVFNFGTTTGQIFKNNATVRINEKLDDSYKYMLMHDTIPGKNIMFEEFDKSEITLQVEVNPDDLLGATDFNIIEMLPYLPGSYDITSIRVYTMQDYRQGALTPSLTINNNIDDFGACRIMIDKTRSLWKCEFDITLNFRNAAGKYPFGLKHMYFLKGNYDPDSHIILKVTRDKFIDWISEKITIHDQNGIYETTCSEEKIELYMSYISGVLSLEIATSLGLGQNPIPKNIKEFYIKLPISCSMISMKFDTIKNR